MKFSKQLIKHIKRINFLLLFVVIALALSFCTNKYKPAIDLPTTFFKSGEVVNYKYFEHEEGIFRFQFKNTLTVKEHAEIYFLKDLSSNKVVFQVFENRPGLEFSRKDFLCRKYFDEIEEFQNREICFSRDNLNDSIINLKIFDEPDIFLKNQFSDLAERGNFENEPPNRSDFLTRAEALSLILKLRYSDRDFFEYKEDCFLDVKVDDPLAGYICYAKKREIVVGIGGYFYPNRGVNLWFLKMLFKTFKINDLRFDESVLDEKLFEQMQKNHLAYPFIAKAYYEGILENFKDEDFWSNRNVRKGEAVQIIHNFLRWHAGEKLTNYNSGEEDHAPSFIYLRPRESFLNFKEAKEFKLENKVYNKIIQKGENVEIFVLTKGNVYEHFYTIEGENINNIDRVDVSFDPDRLTGGLQALYKNKESQIFRIKIQERQFEFLKDQIDAKERKKVRDKLAGMNLLPNEVRSLGGIDIPKLKVHLSESDFENIFRHRTSNERYKSFLEIIYPDGEEERRSIMIKTRGNASRGYIKSSFTIESFKDFDDNPDFEGDEFFKNSDEFKLRGFISEETMIHEKLFYEAFKRLGHLAPDFFEVNVEINGIPMGFYQLTEPVKKKFFERRGIQTNNYFYAQNNDSLFTNLTFFKTKDITLSQYKIRGDADFFFNFIKSLDNNDQRIFKKINFENIFDYAALAFLADAADSLSHNFYVYFDDKEQKWNIFPWDADGTFSKVNSLNRTYFLEFAKRHKGLFNNLIYFLFRNLNWKDVDFYLKNFRRKWNEDVNLVKLLENYQSKYERYFDFDNELWSGKFLERKKDVFDTNAAIEDLGKQLIKLEKL